MESVTLEKNGYQFTVYDRRTKSKQVNNLQVNNRAGYTLNQKPFHAEEEMMLPMGYTLQANGSVETPLERQKRLMKKQKENHQNSYMEDDDFLLPVGVELER